MELYVRCMVKYFWTYDFQLILMMIEGMVEHFWPQRISLYLGT